jgi:hypothetical protein
LQQQQKDTIETVGLTPNGTEPYGIGAHRENYMTEQLQQTQLQHIDTTTATTTTLQQQVMDLQAVVTQFYKRSSDVLPNKTTRPYNKLHYKIRFTTTQMNSW